MPFLFLKGGYMAIDRIDVEAVYPGASKLSDAVINVYIDMTDSVVSTCIPSCKRDMAHSLLAAHYCSKASTSAGAGEIIEIDNGSMKKKFAQIKDTNIKSTDPYSTTQYGQAYLDLVTIYCSGVYFADATTNYYY